MIDRYTRPAMGAIWADRAKIDAWLQIEIQVCEAWYRRGRIPEWAIEAIRTATCDLDRMAAIEAEVDHDTIAFLRATGETVGEASRFIHLGLTSSDIVDTGLAIQSTSAAALILQELDHVIEVVGTRALEHRNTLTIGRTHGVFAEPTTFGMKLLVLFDELKRQRERLHLAARDIAVGKISGAVGTHAHIPPDAEEEVLAALGLGVEPISTQIVQRDRHAFFLTTLAGLAGTLEKMALEVRHLQRSEVREAEEPFPEGNQGSSAMPHKRNPHASERVCGLARLIRGYAVTGLENIALWHERDISHNSTERVTFPDACCVVDFMLAEIAEIYKGLVVYPERMLANLNGSGGVVFSQRVMLALVDAGMDRQSAYKLVQRHALTSWDGGRPFREAITSDPEVTARLNPEMIADLFDPLQQLMHINAAFARTGLYAAEVAR
ncbi:MAG TPA: adenylosuccinate lyase [Thermomicrobiales bacterium]|nr:adenylosuccinate lyase [Thermomicrobiales bacterium]HRA48099.1 adenylosuccinate lyase [Thermomicrobiales bacterium]